jgi:hypothetical protein
MATGAGILAVRTATYKSEIAEAAALIRQMDALSFVLLKVNRPIPRRYVASWMLPGPSTAFGMHYSVRGEPECPCTSLDHGVGHSIHLRSREEHPFVN